MHRRQPSLFADRPEPARAAFTATAPNRIWLADITYVATGEGWLYVAAALDLATRKIVRWAMPNHIRTELPLAALMMTVHRKMPVPGLICHSDRGRNTLAAPMLIIRARSALRPR